MCVYIHYPKHMELMKHMFAYNTVNVTRLIRIAYGDYDLQTIPPGMAMEIPIKPLDLHKRRGNLVTTTTNNSKSKPKALSPSAKEEKSTPVQWVRHS